MPDNHYVLLHSRRQPTIVEESFDIPKQQDVTLSADGRAEPCAQDAKDHSVVTIELLPIDKEKPHLYNLIAIDRI